MTPADAKTQFDRQAAFYHERWASWSDESLRRLLTLADPKPDWRALDIATGTGFTALALAPHVAEVVGLDISPGMLTQASQRGLGVPNVTWIEAGADRLPFADDDFDLVTSRIAPHHFPDVPAFLAESRRVLKPGGVFVLADTTVPDDAPETSDWQNAVEKERDPSHVRNLPPSEWKRLVTGAGLTVTHCDAADGGIGLELETWLETAGATGKRADTVRRMFADAPPSVREAFQIDGAKFVWRRVVLRAERPYDFPAFAAASRTAGARRTL